MHTTFALAALAAVAFATPTPQGVTADITPQSKAPAGCSDSYSGEFQITAVNTTILKRELTERAACGSDGTLTLSLAGGQLKDAKGRTGYIAANYQFQFDGPPQTGAIFTGGFSLCGNGSLALGGSAVFYECLSGSFYNLYDRSWAAQCEPILIDILPCAGSAPASSAAVGQVGDGQPTGTAIATAVSQIHDGQPQAASAIAISEFTDGQPQVPTALPVAQISDGQVQANGAAVTQIGDGQVQAAGATPVSVPAAPISQISDGQVQATGVATAAGPAITQIGDGQIQASGAAAAPATTPAGAPISQIGDGQVQAGNATVPSTPSPSVVPANGASGLAVSSQFAAAILGLVAVALL